MRLRRVCQVSLSLLFPFGPCAVCGKESRSGPAPGICRSCWRERRRVGSPACPTCGFPLPAAEGQADHTCGECLRDPPAYEAHVSAYAYAGPVRALLLLYKDQRRYPLAPLLGRALARRVRRAWPGRTWDLVVYIPSALGKRMVRGFEPAGLVARACAQELGIPCRRALKPRRAVRTQKGLTSARRRENLSGAFWASAKELKGLRVLLVDDIRTTGTTLREAAKVLARAGATVHAATVAMTLKRELDMMMPSKVPVGEGDPVSVDADRAPNRV
jgi:ComF family protein